LNKSGHLNQYTDISKELKDASHSNDIRH